MRIGVPTGLYYYEIGEAWVRFFRALGHEVVFSDKMSELVLKTGCKSCEGGACLPVKAYHGAVESLLKKQPDALFLPRVERPYNTCYTCPKVIGVNYMIKSTFKLNCLVLEPSVRGKPLDGCIKAGLSLGNSIDEIYSAQKKSVRKKFKGHTPEAGDLNISLLGHPYIVCDDVLNLGVKNKLNELGCAVYTGDMLLHGEATLESGLLPKNPFWVTAEHTIGAALKLNEKYNTRGIVYLTAFGCGPDAFILPFLRRFCVDKKIALLELYYDEHSGEEGMNTRLEAFSDLLKRRTEATV